MLLITSSHSLMKHRLTFQRLADCMQYLEIATIWAEGEWGYIRNKGVEYRKGVMDELQNDVYIGVYANQPVAMFALLEHKVHENAFELMYVYVDKNYRGLGFGKQIIEGAKHLATNKGASLILLDTLKPNLDRMYEKHGAQVIGEGRLFSHPTEILQIKL
jgi:GNAT superfamily N-acetyltransferase